MILRRDIFQALADPTRRSILVLLASHTITAGAVADHFELARSTVSKHISILVECGLVSAAQQGREIFYEIKMDQMEEVNIWMQELRRIWETRFDNLENYLEKIQKS